MKVRGKTASGNFTFTDTSIDGVKVVDVRSFGDERGYFMETYKRADFAAGGIEANFVQDNQSFSTKGVLRGLHYQMPTLRASSCGLFPARSLTSPLTCARTARLMANGRGWFSLPRTNASSSSRADLPTVSLF